MRKYLAPHLGAPNSVDLQRVAKQSRWTQTSRALTYRIMAADEPYAKPSPNGRGEEPVWEARHVRGDDQNLHREPPIRMGHIRKRRTNSEGELLP